MSKRIGLGLLTTLLIAAAFDFVPSFLPVTWASERLAGYFYVWPGVEGACVGFLAALGGAYVARVPFIIPAVLFATVSWIGVICFLNSIAAVAGQGDILAVAGSNALGLLFGIVGAAAGAYVGGHISRPDQEGIANAA
jgi:hypothetical protein